MQQKKFEVLTAVNITDRGLLGSGNAQSGEWQLLCQGKPLHRQCRRLFQPRFFSNVGTHPPTGLHGVTLQNSIIVSNRNELHLRRGD